MPAEEVEAEPPIPCEKVQEEVVVEAERLSWPQAVAGAVGAAPSTWQGHQLAITAVLTGAHRLQSGLAMEHPYAPWLQHSLRQSTHPLSQ